MTQPYPPHQGDSGPGRDSTQQMPVVHGQPGQQYGMPHYGGPQYGGPPQGPGPYGVPGAPGPAKRSLLPWLIVTGVALVAALGVLVFLLLRGDDGGTTNAAEQSTEPSAQQSDEGLGDTDGDAVVPPDHDGPEQQGDVIPEDDGTGFGYDASADRAAAFMDRVMLGDYDGAIGFGGQEFQLYYDGDTALFAAEIEEATNGGTLDYDYSIDSVVWDAANEADVVSMTVIMAEGWPDDFTVLIGAEDGNLVVVGFQ
jgi:hypothetical protein